MADKYTNRFSDNIRYFKSKSLTFAYLDSVDDTFNIVRLPRFALVVFMFVNVTTAFTNTTPTVDIGITGATDSIIDGGDLTADITAFTPVTTTTNDKIIVTLIETDTTEGEMTIYGGYTVLV